MPSEYTPIPEDRTLESLQAYQDEHDRAFHKDIYSMTKDQQIRHINDHIMKIAGRLADYSDKLDHGEHEEAKKIKEEIQGKRATDLFILSLMLANRLEINLPQTYLERIKQLEDERMD